VFGGGRFVAVGDSGTVLMSSDGTIWSAANPVTQKSLLSVAYGPGRFVAVGQSGTIVSSSDGVTWLAENSVTTNRLAAVAWTDLGFVAVGDQGTILTSGDAANWTIQSSGTSSRLVGVGNGFGRTFIGAAADSRSPKPALVNQRFKLDGWQAGLGCQSLRAIRL